MAKTVALIPSYQPDAHLIEVLESLSKLGMEEVVVDDGSGMGYRPLFDLAPAGTTLISYVNNCGKGVALKVGLKYIQEHYPNGLEGLHAVHLDPTPYRDQEDGEYYAQPFPGTVLAPRIGFTRDLLAYQR